MEKTKDALNGNGAFIRIPAKQKSGDKIAVIVKCIECGKDVSIIVNKKDLNRYNSTNDLVQNIFPYLSANEREIFISQICGECYDKIFSKIE
jgi:hypothetical protein